MYEKVSCILKYIKNIKHTHTSPYIFEPFKQLSDIIGFMSSLAYVRVVWRWTFPWKIAAMRSNEICFLCLTVCRLVYHRRPCQRAAISLGNGTSMETSVAAWLTLYTENMLKLRGRYRHSSATVVSLFHCFFWSQHIAVICNNFDGRLQPCKHCSFVWPFVRLGLPVIYKLYYASYWISPLSHTELNVSMDFH